jgi:hypothetical protein
MDELGVCPNLTYPWIWSVKHNRATPHMDELVVEFCWVSKDIQGLLDRLVKEICRVQKFEETQVSNQVERFGVYSYRVETLMNTLFSGLIIWGLIILVTKR